VGTVHLFSINGRPLATAQPSAPLSQIVCTLDGQAAICAEGFRIVVRCMQDLRVIHTYDAVSHPQPSQGLGAGAQSAGGTGASHRTGAAGKGQAPNPSGHPGAPEPHTGHPAPDITALSLSPDNHHAFAATADGAFLIYANPLVNIQVLENLATELLNL
jgi:hypothetical protein